MAFYNPPFQCRNLLTPRWLMLIIGLFLILISMFIVSTLDKTPKGPLILDSAIASRALLKEKGPQKVSGHISLASSFNPYLAASVKTTLLEESLVDLLQGAGQADVKSGRYSEIPAGTKLLKVMIHGNTVIVDLSSEFATGGGSTSMIQRVEELKRLIQKFNKNYKLKISVNGKRVQYLGGEGLEIE
jgi:Sporulation and spore germination